ncbi:LpqB family beta-propeller domain-containing protein [Kordiimonas gwangyangensis]|uniref:LpqB family beta-propeller domain-containing protein n=1 Tax=Kordiimonas gwangyangensis TaxID=288022 RepID=UPI000472BD8A|nr:LpqB family beta-propeller domain-containing protein [Kordiimonas gwangyangensis]
MKAISIILWSAALVVGVTVTNNVVSVHAEQISQVQGSNASAYPPILEKAFKTKLVNEVALSPDGEKIAAVIIDYSRETPGRSLRIISGSGKASLIYGLGAPSAPAWSPDGDKLAVISAGALKLINPADGTITALDLPLSVRAFKWSPDGQTLAIVASSPEKPAKEEAQQHNPDWRAPTPPLNALYIVNLGAPQESLRKLSTDEQHVAHALAPGFDWSPDGQAIAFSWTDEALASAWGSRAFPWSILPPAKQTPRPGWWPPSIRFIPLMARSSPS